MYKADVAASRATREELEVALDHLNSAAALNPDENLIKLIEQKKVVFNAAIAAIEARIEDEARMAEQAAAEEAEQEAAQPSGPAEDQQEAAPDH